MLAQAAETASGGVEWGAVEIIALVAVLVTGFTAWLSRSDSKRRLKQEKELHGDQLKAVAEESAKRLAHEERMQAQRLEHERVEAIRTTAAKAYSSSRSVLVNVTPGTVVTMGHEPIDGAELNVRKLVGEAMDSLSVVAAMGWSEPVQDAALGLRGEITNLATDAWKLTKKTREIVRVPTPTSIDFAAYEAFKASVGEANEKVAVAVEAYRQALAGEADQ